MGTSRSGTHLLELADAERGSRGRNDDVKFEATATGEVSGPFSKSSSSAPAHFAQSNEPASNGELHFGHLDVSTIVT